MTPILSIRNLQVSFASKGGEVHALRGVDLDVAPGECLGVVGESGSGKSLTALAALGLMPGSARINGGTALFEGRDLLAMPRAELDQVRGRRIGMIFQEPMTALNPIMTVGRQIMAPLRKHLGLSREAARTRAAELLGIVGIPAPAMRLDSYPHQLSGGMRQRVMIAMALSCEPKVLIADEPTTALDGTIQAQILDLLRRLRSELGLAVIIITHDFGVVAELADRVAVMYGGRVVEEASATTLFDHASHPYSVGLLLRDAHARDEADAPSAGNRRRCTAPHRNAGRAALPSALSGPVRALRQRGATLHRARVRAWRGVLGAAATGWQRPLKAREAI